MRAVEYNYARRRLTAKSMGTVRPQRSASRNEPMCTTRGFIAMVNTVKVICMRTSVIGSLRAETASLLNTAMPAELSIYATHDVIRFAWSPWPRSLSNKSEAGGSPRIELNSPVDVATTYCMYFVLRYGTVRLQVRYRLVPGTPCAQYLVLPYYVFYGTVLVPTCGSTRGLVPWTWFSAGQTHTGLTGMVAKDRKPSKGSRPGAPAPEAADSKLLSVADWLRNEKRSGLHTKEAIQYEKVGLHKNACHVGELVLSLFPCLTLRVMLLKPARLHHLSSHDSHVTGIVFQRVEYFKGSKLVDTLLGPKYKGKLAQETPIKSRAEAAKLAQELLRHGFFHRSQRVTHAHTRRWELELFNGPFEEDGLYTWVYEGPFAKDNRTSLSLFTPFPRKPRQGQCLASPTNLRYVVLLRF